MYIGRDFKRDIELENLKKFTGHLRPNRSWLDLFSLSLSYNFRYNNFDFTTLTDNLNADEVIIIDFHDDILKDHQIHFWRKDSISDILPAVKCPSFKSETKIFKFSEINKIREYIYYRNHAKSIVIENIDEELSINLVYGDIVKITPRSPWSNNLNDLKNDFSVKLQERYKLWEIDGCACKPKKIRIWHDIFNGLQYAIDQLKWIPNISDVELGIHIN